MAKPPRPGASAPPSGLLHESFQAGVLVKGVFALVEALSGVLLWIGGDRAVALVQRLTFHELTAHPGDRIAASLARLAESYSLGTQEFYALYLLGHGLVKLVLVAGLWREASWAFPVSIVAMLGFIAYQLHRYAHTGALGLLLLTIVDVVVLLLIWQEYRARRRAGLA